MEFNGPVDFFSPSGEILASQGDVILAPSNETVVSGGQLVPRLDLAQNLGDENRRWDTIYTGSGNFTERPTVNGSGVLLQGEAAAAGGGGSGVDSLNGLTGDVDIVGVSGVDVSTSDQNILVGTNVSGLTTIIQEVGFSGLFGSIFSEAAENQTTNSTVYVQAVRLTTPADLEAGTYRIAWSMQVSADGGDEDEGAVFYRVQLDDTTELMEVNPIFETADTALQFGGFTHEFLTGGVHTIDVDFRTTAGDVAAIIERTRVDMWRIS